MPVACGTGLLALLVRLGVPVPCQRGARVDFFSPILADIGDMQSVTGDLSTFSGHLLVWTLTAHLTLGPPQVVRWLTGHDVS